MGKRADIEARIAQLQAELDAGDDDDLEVWVENRDGHRTKLTGQRAVTWLRRNGYDPEDIEPGEVVEPKKAAPAKKAPAKKAAPKPAAAEEPADDEPDAPESDDEPATGHRFFR